MNDCDPLGTSRRDSVLQHFKYDEFGLQILKHYLTGKGKTKVIKNDTAWKNYLSNAKMCTNSNCNNEKKHKNFLEYAKKCDNLKSNYLTLRQYIGQLIYNRDVKLPKKYNMNTGDGSVCLELDEKENIRLTDEQAKAIIEVSSGCKNATEFQALPKAEQEKFIETFKEKGLSIRQVSRLTGVSFGLVRKRC